MTRKKTKGKAAGFTMFNVTYEDGTMTSNRRVARTAIQEQNNDIAHRSRQRRAKIKAITKA